MTGPLTTRLARSFRLTEQDRSRLDTLLAQRVRRLAGREDLIREGERPQAVTLVLEGWAYRYKTLEDGRRQIISFLLPGDVCDLNVFTIRESDHSIGAITPLTIVEITSGAFEDMVGSSGTLRSAFWWMSHVNAAIQREWTVNLGQRDGYERMAHLICELFYRLEETGLTEGGSFELPVTQNEMGEALGLSTVHINRVLKELRLNRLIALKERTMSILDLPALQRKALFNPTYLHLGARLAVGETPAE